MSTTYTKWVLVAFIVSGYATKTLVPSALIKKNQVDAARQLQQVKNDLTNLFNKKNIQLGEAFQLYMNQHETRPLSDLETADLIVSFLRDNKRSFTPRDILYIAGLLEELVSDQETAASVTAPEQPKIAAEQKRRPGINTQTENVISRPDSDIDQNANIRDRVIEGKMIARKEIDAEHIKSNSITWDHLASETIRAGNIIPYAITGYRIKHGSVSANNLSPLVQSLLADVLDATDESTAETVVKRDATGSASFKDLLVEGDLAVSSLSGTFSVAGDTVVNNLTVTGDLTASFSELDGDVTGDYDATTVESVGGKTAAAIASAVSLVESSTSSKTPDTLVIRNNTGKIFADVSGSITGTVYDATISGTLRNIAVYGTSLSELIPESVVIEGSLSTTENIQAQGSLTVQESAVFEKSTHILGTLNLDKTRTATAGVITQNNAPIFHRYKDHIFIGASSGNFAASSNANSTHSNVAVGNNTLKNITSGNSNIAVGTNSLSLVTTSSSNAALGTGALAACASGNSNTAVGTASGAKLITGSNNIYIASNDGPAVESSIIRLGSTLTHTSCFIAGVREVTTNNNDGLLVVIDSKGQLGTTSSSRRYKKDITPLANMSDKLNALKPVAFKYKNHSNGKQEMGLIAEEVLEVIPDIVVRNNYGQAESVQYQYLPIMLLSGFQHQTNQIDVANKRIEQLESTVQKLLQKTARLEEENYTLKNHIASYIKNA